MHEINEWFETFMNFLKQNQFSFSNNKSELNIFKLQSFLGWLRKQYENQQDVFTVEELQSVFMNTFPFTLSLSQAGFSRYLSGLESTGILVNIKHGLYKITGAVITFDELLKQMIKQSQLHLLAMKLKYHVPSDFLKILTTEHVKLHFRKNFIFTLLQELIDSAKENVFIAFKKEVLCSSNMIAKSLLRKYREGINVRLVIIDYKCSRVKIKNSFILCEEINSSQECLHAYLHHNLIAKLVQVENESNYPINLLLRDTEAFFTFNHFQLNLNPDNYLIQAISPQAKQVLKNYSSTIQKKLKFN